MSSIAKHARQRTNLLDGMLVTRCIVWKEENGWSTAKPEMAAERDRELKYYGIPEEDRKQLVAEESPWQQMAASA